MSESEPASDSPEEETEMEKTLLIVEDDDRFADTLATS